MEKFEMFAKMQFVLWVAAGLSILTACGGAPAADSITSLPSTAEITIPPAPQASSSAPTSAPGSGAGPTPTKLPPASESSPLCFVSSAESVPFTFMPDSVRILIKERSGVRVFNLETLKEENYFPATQDLFGVALSPDGELLAWSLADNSIQLIGTSDGKLINTMKDHTLPVTKLRFSPAGDHLFSASMDTWVRIWDRNGKQLDAFEPSGADNLPNDIEGMGISPDGAMLGSIPFDGPTRIWNLADKKEIANLGGTGGDVTSNIAFSSDGQFVAASQLSRLSLWSTSDWKQVWTGVLSMAFAFSPDGRFLAYSDIDDDYNVTIRSLPEIDEARALEKSQGASYELFFSPDGTLLASAGAGIRIWKVETGQLAYIGKEACP
jgi:WD40 repeat protein